MVVLVPVFLAWYADAGPLPRVDEPTTMVRCTRVDGSARARGKARNGPVEAWVLPDGTAVSWRALQPGDGVVGAIYDPFGAVRADARREADHERVTAGARTVDTTSWSGHDLGPLHVRLPEHAVRDALGAVAETAGGRLTVRWYPGATDDPTGPEFADATADAAAGHLVDRTTAWIAGRPGVRLRLALVCPTSGCVPPRAEVWAAAFDGGVFVVTEAGTPSAPLAAGVVLFARLVEGDE